MFTMATGLRGQARHEARIPTKALRFAALLGTLILVSVAVIAMIVVADRNTRARSSAARSCSAVTQMADRLACYDKLANQPAPHPFRGTNAPALDPSL
jgi:hypothetical protein